MIAQADKPIRKRVRLSSMGRRSFNNGGNVLDMIAGGKRYDAASTNRHNKNHWKYADGRDANSLISPALATLRNRTRYEHRNNPMLKGIVRTFADDFVGTGPRLQMLTDDTDFNSDSEKKFSDWSGDGEGIMDPECDVTNKDTLSGIIRMCASIQLDTAGEGFIVMSNSPKPSASGGPRLKLQAVEADRIANPMGVSDGAFGESGGIMNQGIESDESGKPLNYYISKVNPGATSPGFRSSSMLFGKYTVVAAAFVIHIARPDRPGQNRGVPEYAPSIESFGKVRDFVAATVAAANTAANLSGVMNTKDGAVDDDNDTYEAMDTVELERDTLLTLPEGWEAKQFTPEQPVTTFKDFHHEMIGTAARPKGMPLNKALANSSGYNYSSGRLDHQSYYGGIDVWRAWVNRMVLRRILRTWFQEAMLIPGFVTGGGKFRDARNVSAGWFWPGHPHVDPKKQADAEKIRLDNGSINLADISGTEGRDWEKHLEMTAKVNDKMKKLGLTQESPVVVPTQASED